MKGVNTEQLLRPTQYVEKILVTAILDGTYACGTALPNERSLAKQIGVTRPTLRETLQRLAGEGWINIHHGKPTMVNDYWQEGGLRLLGTLSKYSDYLPNGFVVHLLEVRQAMLPVIAGGAARFQPKLMLDYLTESRFLAEDAQEFADYDWKLQLLMARNSQNPVFSLILNDFAQIFAHMAVHYFNHEKARQVSRKYYLELTRAVEERDGTVESIVQEAMAQSISIWKEVKTSKD